MIKSRQKTDDQIKAENRLSNQGRKQIIKSRQKTDDQFKIEDRRSNKDRRSNQD